ncbi:MAG TPA: family 43 glycosylhydrolase [Acidobacteriaceae bacterium]|nr:family 43 glycosylhydrolase [Acidobacteriaceae bacterium]
MRTDSKLLRSSACAAIFCIAGLFGPNLSAQHQSHLVEGKTYCNPLNLDYTYKITESDKDISYRSGADPAVVEFRGGYYMFVTRSLGYWYSDDLTRWSFIKPQRWYFQGSNAPAAQNYRDQLLYVTGDPSGTMSLLYTDDPKKGDWQAVPALLHNLQDPDFYMDDDGRAYMFWGSSNRLPIRGEELDPKHRFLPMSGPVELFHKDEAKHGWERFGENHDDPKRGGFIEGSWLTKHDGKYYMQYAAPGTEWNTYGDGVYVGSSPLGPYTYAPNNPISYKPGGFINGAGHGSTVAGPGGQYWHFATMAIAVNYKYERRIGMFPTFFDRDGVMYADTAFGDYPHYAPSSPAKKGGFTGWMLLSYKKPVTASSHLGDFTPDKVTDEQVKTFWVASDNGPGQWLQIDLETVGTIRAFQINYHDYKSDLYGRPPGMYEQYVVESSMDGERWTVIHDRSKDKLDTPNDYVELPKAVEGRYVRFKSLHVPTPNLAISEFRIFGNVAGSAPAAVSGVAADRESDRRNVLVKWDSQPGSQGYNVRWGIAPDKLYSSWMVYGHNSVSIRALNVDQKYYFTVEAFDVHGVGPQSGVIEAP